MKSQKSRYDQACALCAQITASMHRRKARRAGETPEALTLRFENVAHELHGVIEKTKQALHPHYLVVLETLRAALTVQMGKLEAVNRKAFTAYGVPYAPENDAMLLSLARFLDGAGGKLDNVRCVCWPDEMKSFLGELKPAGLFK